MSSFGGPSSSQRRGLSDLPVTVALALTLAPAYVAPWDPLSGGPILTGRLGLCLLAFTMGTVLAFATGHRLAPIKVLLVATIAQNVLVGFFASNETPAPAIWLGLGYKSFVLIIVAGIAVVSSIASRQRPAIERHEVALVVFISFILGTLVLGRVSFGFSQLGNLRNFASLFLLYAVGRICVRSWDELCDLSRFLIRFAIVIVVFGLVERFCFDVGDWVGMFHINRITEVKFQVLYVDPTQLEISAPSWFTSYVGLYSGRRLASLVADPVNLSAILASLSFLSWKMRGLRATTLLVVFCLLLTFGKAAHLGLLTAIWIDYRTRTVTPKQAIFEISPFIVIASIVMLTNDIFGAIHIRGLLGPWQGLFHAPFGHGLGEGGNLAQIVGTVDRTHWIATGGESGLGVALYQFGIVAFALPLFAFFLISRFHEALPKVPDFARPLLFAATGMLVISFIGSVFQEAALGPQATTIPYLYAGAAFGALSHLEMPGNGDLWHATET